MGMKADLVSRLVGAAGVGALVGDRVSWFDFQRGDPVPALSLTTISPGREYTHDGWDGLDGPRIQFDCRAADDDGAEALKLALIAEMEAGAEIGGTRFHPAQLEGEREIFEGEQDGGQSLFRISLDFIFYHEEI